jgi:hypothetical protein
MRVTIFRNWFKDSMQRMPHCRYDVIIAWRILVSLRGFFEDYIFLHGEIFEFP